MITWIGIIASIIIGFMTMPAGLIIMIVGCLVSWISSFLLYGFGQLIENSDACVRLLSTQAGEEKAVQTVPAEKAPAVRAPLPDWTCYNCGTVNQGRVHCCNKCGVTKIWSDNKHQNK